MSRKIAAYDSKSTESDRAPFSVSTRSFPFGGGRRLPLKHSLASSRGNNSVSNVPDSETVSEGIINQLSVDPIPGFREPINSFTHLVAAIIFAGLTIVLLRRSQGSSRQKLALGIFGFSSVLLLSMSGIYHMLWPGNGREIMERLDVAAIFTLIAGTFTPAYAILYRGLSRTCLLWLVWGTAILGMTFRLLFFEHLSGWWGTGLFLVFGWLGAISVRDFWKRYSFAFIKPLLWGGLAYTGGAILLQFRWPTLIPRILGPHELWHVAVLIGLSFHWRFVWQIAQGNPELVSR